MSTPDPPAAPDSAAPGRQRPRPVRPPADACAARWASLDAPAWGSAATANFWVALEQPGPWGSDAFTSSRLDPSVGMRLASRTANSGGRALLIRTPGGDRAQTADTPRDTEVSETVPGPRRRRSSLAHRAPAMGRRVLIAGGMPQGRPVLYSGIVPDAAALLDLPWADLRTGHADTAAAALGLRAHPKPVFLVCTNAKRDVCCAVLGLPIARALAAAHPGRVFECSHTGGHRFAPTGVLLPSGVTLGRLTPGLADAVLAAPAHRLPPEVVHSRYLRGLAHLTAPLQAADADARRRASIEDLTVSTQPRLLAEHPGNGPDRVIVEVSLPARGAADARTAIVEVVTISQRRELPASCGATPAPATYLDVRPLNWPTDG